MYIMNENSTQLKKVIALAKKLEIIKPRDLVSKGLSANYLYRLYEQGLFEKIGHGLYRLVNEPINENSQLIEVQNLYPNSVITLLSALSFHEITTQNPSKIWIALQRQGWRSPKNNNHLPIHVVIYSGHAYTAGINEHTINNLTVRIYCLEKTIADCFKYRNKIGLDVAIEALKEGLKQKSFNIDNLWKYAKICRVQNVIRPYLEAME